MAASPRHLAILDVDGTLVHSLGAEALLYPRACEQALALSSVSSDWTSYRCPSDRGIVRELVERNCARAATAEDYMLVEQRFLALIQEAYEQQPGLCQAVAGAIEAVERFRQLPELALAIATAGWMSTAKHKLAVAGFSVDDLPLTTSRDAEAKVDIMRVAADRAALRYRVDEFESVVCFGDSTGDATAAFSLGFEFIGIDTAEFLADATHRYADFSEIDAIVRTLALLRGKGVSVSRGGAWLSTGVERSGSCDRLRFLRGAPRSSTIASDESLAAPGPSVEYRSLDAEGVVRTSERRSC